MLHNLRRSSYSSAIIRRTSSNASWASRRILSRDMSTVTEADNEGFYRHSTGRWLYNDSAQQLMRYTPFNIAAIKDIACNAVGARQCVHFSKIGEGSYNKVFLMRFDNDKEAIARIATPLAGNTYLSTASEAATLEYLREVLEVKVPRVYAWSSRSKPNQVGADYIIMERVPGVGLMKRWLELSSKEVAMALAETVVMEFDISVTCFSQIGSLFFKEDVSPELQALPLYLKNEENATNSAQKYRVGPIVEREWWRPGHLNVKGDRGPWPNIGSFITAAARLERQYLKDMIRNSSTLPPYCRSTKDDIDEILKLLDYCVSVAPFLDPNSPSISSPVLAHPDLSLSNVMVASSDVATVQAFIDWQGAHTAPLLMQPSLPPLVIYNGSLIPIPADGSQPKLPENFNRLAPDKQEELTLHHRLAKRQHGYGKHLCERDWRRAMVWSMPQTSAMSMLPRYALRGWADVPLMLRQTLIEILSIWDEICLDKPCPIHFTAEELKKHEAQYASASRYQRSTEKLKMLVNCDSDGWVPIEHFDEAKRIMEEARLSWSDEDCGGPFPFYDGAQSYFMS